jgi:murein DD-endopeptidase MepM/ murein hydrolase activator NlpD
MAQPTHRADDSRRNPGNSLVRVADAWLDRLNAAGNSPFRGRWTREHWMLASLFATMSVMIVAIVPGFASAKHTPRAERTTLALALPALPKFYHPAPIENWQVLRVQKGQTLSSMFADLGLPASDLQRVLAQPGAAAALGRLRDGDELSFDIGDPGELHGLRFNKDDNTRVEMRIGNDAIKTTDIERPSETRLEASAGVIEGSLYAAGMRAGLSEAAIQQMTNAFSYDIDFAQDLRPGDSFQVVHEEIWRDGERQRNGSVIAASFENAGKRYYAYRYIHDGKTEYVDENGRPLKKSFMRTPVEYTRISSGFTAARLHPILGTMRAHKGVDYAAPTGTPVMAAGDARVAFAGWKNGYGNCIILDHGRGYTTLYGHMSRLGKYRVGAHVAQGTVIGYVGMTGLATGPHLHYEFRINGNYRNPLSVTMPKPEPLSGAALAQFHAQIAPALAQLKRLQESQGILAQARKSGARG